MNTATLLISCPDRKGLVKEIASFIASNGGNIIHFDQHIDFQRGIFFARVEWDLEDFSVEPAEIGRAFGEIAKRFSMDYSLFLSSDIEKVAIFASKLEHCMFDILQRFKAGELKGVPALVISNHPDHRDIADFFGVPFFHIPKTSHNRDEAEKKELALLEEYGAGTIILARYMQILSPTFVRKYENRIINIHHSFLPAFPGAKPYHRAYQKGVKIIGATSHYVTENLDEGPIIEQDIVRVSHRDSLEDFIRKGRDLEKIVLARAVKWHLENKVLVYENRTVVFD